MRAPWSAWSSGTPAWLVGPSESIQTPPTQTPTQPPRAALLATRAKSSHLRGDVCSTEPPPFERDEHPPRGDEGGDVIEPVREQVELGVEHDGRGEIDDTAGEQDDQVAAA